MEFVVAIGRLLEFRIQQQEWRTRAQIHGRLGARRIPRSIKSPRSGGADRMRTRRGTSRRRWRPRHIRVTGAVVTALIKESW